MAESVHVDNGLWAVLEPLLPERVPRRIARPRVDDRIAFTAWEAAGVWDRLHRELLRRLNALGRLEWSTGVVDASHIRALRGGPLTGRSPVARARVGSKHHLIVDCQGVPLAATLTGGHRNESRNCCPSSMGSAIAGKRGRPRRRPDRVIADRGYDLDKFRRELWRRGVKPVDRARYRALPAPAGGCELVRSWLESARRRDGGKRLVRRLGLYLRW